MVSSKEDRQRIKHNRAGSLGYGACSKRSEDKEKMKEAANNMHGKLSAPSVSELIQNYNGDKYKVAYELTRSKLGREGTPEQYKKEYQNMLDDINRYLKKRRSPSEAMKQRFKELYLPESKKNLQIKIRGCVKVSEDYYYKDSTWRNPITIPASDVKEFLSRAKDNNLTGYGIMNSFYMNSKTYVDESIIWLDNVEIIMSFT